jgi:hypothetical protein
MSETTLRMVIELTYDGDLMHGDDEESLDWFYDQVLMPEGNRKKGEELSLFSNLIGDVLGDVTVLSLIGVNKYDHA